MAVRSTMAALISAVRLLINDPSDPNAVPPLVPLFSDQALQDALDHTRQDVNYLELAGKQTIQPGGRVVWLDYYAMTGSAGLGDWEGGVVLQGYPSFAVLTPITSDPLVGHWTFDTSLYVDGQRPPVYLVGKNYDRYAAAVEVLEYWAAQMKLKFGFSSGNQKFYLQQQSANILNLIKAYQMKARPRLGQMVRNDIPSGLWQRGRSDLNRTSF